MERHLSLVPEHIEAELPPVTLRLMAEKRGSDRAIAQSLRRQLGGQVLHLDAQSSFNIAPRSLPSAIDNFNGGLFVSYDRIGYATTQRRQREEVNRHLADVDLTPKLLAYFKVIDPSLVPEAHGTPDVINELALLQEIAVSLDEQVTLSSVEDAIRSAQQRQVDSTLPSLRLVDTR